MLNRLLYIEAKRKVTFFWSLLYQKAHLFRSFETTVQTKMEVHDITSCNCVLTLETRGLSNRSILHQDRDSSENEM